MHSELAEALGAVSGPWSVVLALVVVILCLYLCSTYLDEIGEPVHIPLPKFVVERVDNEEEPE